jgi:hypothetical protein
MLMIWGMAMRAVARAKQTLGLWLLAVALGPAGCIVDVPFKLADAASEASRRHGVSPWTGHYVFSECRPDATDACWTYDVFVDSEGDAAVRADGPDLAIHVVSKPEVEDGALRLPFHHYIDGNPDDDVIHLPFQKRSGFPAGELLGAIGPDRRCLAFAALRSPLASRRVCVAAAAPQVSF